MNLVTRTPGAWSRGCRRRDDIPTGCRAASAHASGTAGGMVPARRSGAKKNPATVRLRTGRYAKPETLAILARSEQKTLDGYVMRLFDLQIGAAAARLGVRRRVRGHKKAPVTGAGAANDTSSLPHHATSPSPKRLPIDEGGTSVTRPRRLVIRAPRGAGR